MNKIRCEALHGPRVHLPQLEPKNLFSFWQNFLFSPVMPHLLYKLSNCCIIFTDSKYINTVQSSLTLISEDTIFIFCHMVQTYVLWNLLFTLFSFSLLLNHTELLPLKNNRTLILTNWRIVTWIRESFHNILLWTLLNSYKESIIIFYILIT